MKRQNNEDKYTMDPRWLNLLQQCCHSINTFWAKNVLVQKNIWVKTFFGQNNIWVERFLIKKCVKKFLDNKTVIKNNL